MSQAAQTDDPFFHLPGNSEWNALIGRQGDEENYVDGYIQAAIELATAVLEKKMYEKRDTLVLPILYNARHSVELSLKFAIHQLNEMGVTNFHEMHHNITTYWEHLNGTELGDETLREHVAALKPYVDSLSQIDDDGQELRYAENREGQKSLKDRALANIAVIWKSLEDLNKVMSGMKYRLFDLADERRTGSFTSRCSRRDLFEIARMLPQKDQWSTPLFDETKADVMKRFGIPSNRTFSEAVNVIKDNREMGVIIGLERNLIHLTDEHAMFVVDQWSKCHPPRTGGDDLGISVFDLDVAEMQERLRIENQVNEAICATLTPDEIADVEAIFYIGRDRIFCEYYEQRLASTQKEHRLNGELAVEVDHLMEKTNFLDCLAAGITKLGRPNLARRLKDMRPDQART